MKIEQLDNIFYYWCDCGAQGKQIFRPNVETGVLVTAIQCAMCGYTEQIILGGDTFNDDMSWVPFKVNNERF